MSVVEGLAYIEKISFDNYNKYQQLKSIREDMDFIPILYWQIRYSGPGKTGIFVKNKKNESKAQNLADRLFMKQLKKSQAIALMKVY
jgi:hypothetical protein